MRAHDFPLVGSQSSVFVGGFGFLCSRRSFRVTNRAYYRYRYLFVPLREAAVVLSFDCTGLALGFRFFLFCFSGARTDGHLRRFRRRERGKNSAVFTFIRWGVITLSGVSSVCSCPIDPKEVKFLVCTWYIPGTSVQCTVNPSRLNPNPKC